MINRIFPIIAICMIALLTFAMPTSAQSKKDDEVKSLGDILNPPIDYGNENKPLTAKIMANYYYKNCTADEHLVLTKNEQEILCGCNSAKMSELLTVQEFKDLDKKTRKGRDARGRMLAHSYAPCMEYAVERKITRQCYRSERIKDIVVGKKIICKCVSNHFTRLINLNASTIIMDAMHYNPMTLDPLTHYFTTENYEAQHDIFLKRCLFDFSYARDNK